MAYSNSWKNQTAADPVTVTIAPNANDVLIGGACTDNGQSGGGFALSSTNWVSDFDIALNSVDGQQSVAGHLVQATGSETGAIFDDSFDPAIACVASFSGRDNAAPLSTTPVSVSDDTSDASPSNLSVSITPAHNGCDLCILAFWDVSASVDVTSWQATTTSGTTSAWTVRQDANSTFRNMALMTATQTTAGAITVDVQGSHASGNAARHVVIYALKPAAGASSTNRIRLST